MFRDIDTSDTNLTVLTQGMWPTMTIAKIPLVLMTAEETFRKQYKEKFPNRNLKFLLAGSLEIKYGKYILHTNIPQGFILLSLETPKSIETICQETNISENLVSASLEALTLAKHRILIKRTIYIIQMTTLKIKHIP